MIDRARDRFLRLAALAVASLAATGHGACPGRVISGDYILRVDGRPVDVVRTPMPEPSVGMIWDELARQPYSYATFELTNEAEVVVRSGVFDLSATEILPQSKGAAAVTRTADTVVFRMKPSTTLVLEPRGRHRTLVLNANRPDPAPPAPDDPGVRYFAPGFHRAGRITMRDGETLYLAPGAWVEGFVEGGGQGLRIRGGGVLSGAAWDWGKGPVTNEWHTLVHLSGRDIEIRDVTLFSSWSWTLLLSDTTNAVVDNVKVVCGRVINDDGIDISRSKGVVIRNSFVRSMDDTIAPKFWCEDLTVTNCMLWADAANVFRIGYECDSRASEKVFRNLFFGDIDIVHQTLNRNTPEEYWANSAINIQPSNRQTMFGIVFENLRFGPCDPKDVFLNVRTMRIDQDTPGCLTDEAGTLDGLLLRNIALPDSQGGMIVNLHAFDEAHPIRARFENVRGYGRVTKSPHALLETDQDL